ncbi:MAG: efflux RND transporter periplasmic adaptor subunit [Pyrinomonadaceae bacterium]
MNEARNAGDNINDGLNDAGNSVRSTRAHSSLDQTSNEAARRRRFSTRSLVIAASLLALCLLVAWLAVHRAKNETEAAEAIVEVEVAPSLRTEMREYVEASGTLNALPGHEASFSASVAGRVTHVLVQTGEHVQAGQTLAELDRSVLAAQTTQAEAALQQARATATQARTVSARQSQPVATDQIRQAEGGIAQARANQSQAQNNLARLQRLFERGIAARKEVEEAQTQATLTSGAAAQAQSALDAARAAAARGIGEARTQASISVSGVAGAEAALNVARAELARSSIRAPINGTLTRRAINDGETIDPATPVFEIIDASSLDLLANLPAQYLGQVKTGNLASVKVEPFPEREFTGGVVSVAPAVDPQTNTVGVRVRLPNERGELKAGLYADARIAVEIHANALVVPEAALVTEGDDVFVFVVQHKNKDEETVEKRKVIIGIRDVGRVEITSGLKDSETVVTTGAFGLSDGAKIKEIETTKDAPDAANKDADKGANGREEK